MYTIEDIIGMIAGILIVFSYIPQLVTIIMLKSARDVSITMYVICLIAQVFWCVYGFLKMDIQVIWTNIICGFITILIISASVYYEIQYQNKKKQIVEEIIEL